MASSRVSVSRKDLHIKLEPHKDIVTGAIYLYKGTNERLKGFMLIHEVNPVFDSLFEKDENGHSTDKKIVANDLVKAEVLLPSRNYSDYCLFWINKKDLVTPSTDEYQMILARLDLNRPEDLKGQEEE
jgi:hypothetical protein